MIKILEASQLVVSNWGSESDEDFLWVSWQELTGEERKQVNVERVLNGFDPTDLNDPNILYTAIQRK